MKILMILNDPPYGSERSYNGLRLAGSLVTKSEQTDLTVFLTGDAVACAKAGQKPPTGFYNAEHMLKPVVARGAVLVCRSCLDARGLGETELLEGARRSNMQELTELTLAADKVIVF